MSEDVYNDEYDKMEYSIPSLPFDMPRNELIREWSNRGKIIEKLIKHFTAPSYVQWQRDQLISEARESIEM